MTHRTVDDVLPHRPARRLRACMVRRTEDLSPAELEAIAKTEMDSRHNHLDAELT